MYKLIIEDDEGKTTVVPLIRDEISIGRKEGNTIRLTERNVSRRHAKLVKQNGAVFIEDLESYNGIKVNGNRIAGRVAVAEGDRIQIGDYVLGLKVEGQQAAASKPAAAGASTTPAPAVRAPGAVETGPDAPTAQIDVSKLPEGESARQAGDPARIVCVSSNFAGLEFELSKPVMVIGRTEDNDIVVNHRSISRHHARIVEENGRYTIIDMQSANGVRVNGEEYGKVELRKADYIDLGHVRLRFVAPGEDFVFSRDATVVDPSAPSSRGAIWVVLALVAVVGVGLLLWKLIAKPDDGSGTKPGTSSGAVASPGSGTGVATSGTSASAGADQSDLLSKLHSALGRQDWDTALKHCAQLQGKAKTGAKDNCERAQSEKAAKKLFDDATAAATRNEHKVALETFLKIPKASAYVAEREKSAQYLDAKKKYEAQALAELDDLIKGQKCADAKTKAAAIKRLLPEVTGLAKKVASCTTAEDKPPVVAKRPRPTGKRPVRVVKRPVKKPKKPAGLTAAEKDALKPLGKQALNAYMGNSPARAFALGRKYLRAFPNDQKVLAIVGAAACKLKRGGEAKRAYRRLQPARRAMLKNLCLKENIALP